MPSPLYSKLLTAVGGFVDASKAADVIGRQLVKHGATPDNFSADHLKASTIQICGALSLYVPDKARRDEMSAKVAALGG